ncbi:TetR/AcrR family transcriptional regulator [Nocardia brasiliensis]
MPTPSTARLASDAHAIPRRRVTKRRAETRERMLNAAYEVFAEEGFGKAKLDQICERAGYTRGAFYSQFTSMDEVFLMLWARHAQRMLDDIRAVLDAAPSAEVLDVRQTVEHALRAIPMDEKWFRIDIEFMAHAQRHPELRRIAVEQELTTTTAILPVIEALLHRVGRTVTDRETLGHALTAVHDGTAIQCMMEPDNESVRQRRIDLFTQVVLAYSAEIEADTPTITS